MNKIKCLKCQSVREREEEFCDITAQVKGLKGIEESLSQMRREEYLGDDALLDCDCCGSKQKSLKWIDLRHLPPILTFSLSRFTFDYDSLERVKINDRFSFPMELDMRERVEHSPEGPLIYELHAVIIHRGGAYGGHYHTYIQDRLGEGVRGMLVPEVFQEEPIREEKVTNVAIQQRETHDMKKGKHRPAEKEEKKVEISYNYDLCDFPIPYGNPQLREGWYDFNDTTVTEIPVGRLQSTFGNMGEAGYILIYRRRDLGNQLEREMPQYLKQHMEMRNILMEQQREFYKNERDHIQLTFQDHQLLSVRETIYSTSTKPTAPSSTLTPKWQLKDSE